MYKIIAGTLRKLSDFPPFLSPCSVTSHGIHEWLVQKTMRMSKLEFNLTSLLNEVVYQHADIVSKPGLVLASPAMLVSKKVFDSKLAIYLEPAKNYGVFLTCASIAPDYGKWMMKYLMRIKVVKPGYDYVEIGPGGGHFAASALPVLRPKASTFVDISAKNIGLTRERLSHLSSEVHTPSYQIADINQSTGSKVGRIDRPQVVVMNELLDDLERFQVLCKWNEFKHKHQFFVRMTLAKLSKSFMDNYLKPLLIKWISQTLIEENYMDYGGDSYYITPFLYKRVIKRISNIPFRYNAVDRPVSEFPLYYAPVTKDKYELYLVLNTEEKKQKK